MKPLFSIYHCLSGTFETEENLYSFVSEAESRGYKIREIRSPYPISEMSIPSSSKRDISGLIGFIFGLTGFMIAVFLIWYIQKTPTLIYGNKSGLMIPILIPIIFVFTILFSCLGVFLSFMIRNHLLPGQSPQIPYPENTSCEFSVFVETDAYESEIRNLFELHQATNIKFFDLKNQNYDLPLPLNVDA